LVEIFEDISYERIALMQVMLGMWIKDLKSDIVLRQYL